MNYKYIIYYLCLLILTFSCTSNNTINDVPYIKKDHQVYERILTSFEKDDSKLVHDKVPLNIDENKTIINWEIYQSWDKQLMFSIPSTWSIEEKIGNELYCNIDKQKKTFFVLLAHNKLQHDLTLKSYLDLVYNTFLTDTTEVLVNMEIQQLTLKNRIGYLVEVETLLENIPYKSYSFYTEDKVNVFDFTLKTKEVDSSILEKVLFNIVISNFKINNSRLYDRKYRDLEIKNIDIGFKK